MENATDIWSLVGIIAMLILGGSGWIATLMKTRAERKSKEQQNQDNMDAKKLESDLSLKETKLKHQLDKDQDFQRTYMNKVFDKYVEQGEHFMKMYSEVIVETNKLIKEEIEQGKNIYTIIDVMRHESQTRFNKIEGQLKKMEGMLAILNAPDAIHTTKQSVEKLSSIMTSLKNEMNDVSDEIKEINEVSKALRESKKGTSFKREEGAGY